MKALKTLLVERFEAESLSMDQLTRLQDIANEREPQRKRWQQWHIAAIAAMSFVAGVLLTQKVFIPDVDYVERIAAEVVRNHLAAKPLEFATNDIDATAEPLAAMGFAPVRSRLLAQLDTELVGGRHCSLQGAPAAQLRLDAVRGQHRTLFQVPYQRELFGPVPDVTKGQLPAELMTKGVPVRLWQEQGMLFVLAGEKMNKSH